jgi:CheY-specific phosphatase CheX
VLPAPDAALRAFLEAARDVLWDAIGVEARVGSQPHVGQDGFTVVIRARGDLAGVAFRFPVVFARHVARTMAPGLPYDRELGVLAVGELANQLTGRGLPALAAHGVVLDIEPPIVDRPIVSYVAAGTLVTELGVVEIALCEAAA